MSFLKKLIQRDKVPLEKVQPGAYCFLVVGCGRSGTHFLAKFLQLNGLDIGHEATGKAGAVAWLLAAEDVRRQREVTFEKTAHIIRSPVTALRSLQTMTRGSWDYVFRYLPQCRHSDPFVASARYWVWWNRLSREQASLSVRLEDFEEDGQKTAAKLSEFFELPLDPSLIAAARESGDSRRSHSNYGRPVEPSYIMEKDPDTYREMKILGESFSYRQDESA